MFSEAYKKLCIENAERWQEMWEPKVGDWIWHPVTEQFHADVAVIIKLYPSFPNRARCVDVSSHNMAWGPTELEGDWFWLPSQRQLIELLEERGYWLRFDNVDHPPDRYHWEAYNDQRSVHGCGPDPETALLRALVEVIEKEEKDG